PYPNVRGGRVALPASVEMRAMSTGAAPSQGEARLPVEGAAAFLRFLADRQHFSDDAAARSEPTDASDGQGTLRKLWESTDLSAHDFADEVARFFGLPRVDLPQLLAAAAEVKQFSPRFLRQMTVFPYRSEQGEPR